MRSAILSLILLCFSTNAAQALVKIDITEGHREPLPIALPVLKSKDGKLDSMGKKMMEVVSADLERSGLFRVINRNAYIENIAFGQTVPRFADWRQIKAQALVSGQLTPASNGQNIKVSFRLWDVFAEKQLTGKEFTTLEDNWRRVSHLMADEIYKYLTGENGYFDSRVVYIAESGPAQRRVKRLAIMDQDGANHVFLSNGKDLVLTPRFSPSFQEVIYLSYAGRRPHVHLRNLETGQDEVVVRANGMSYAPRFSSDGRKIIMSIAENGNSDVYLMDLRSRKKQRLTTNPAIDTSPCFSPDGRQITFNSDRGGKPQIYTMTASGSNVQRVSFGDGSYNTPVWSPRGDLIAFTKMKGGTFYIGVMRPDGSGERLLTEGYLVEGPTWSSNGRVIMFTRQNRGSNRSKLYSIDVTGFNEREVITPTDASDPAWSPLMPL